MNTTVKTMAFQAPQVLHAILDKLADALADATSGRVRLEEEAPEGDAEQEAHPGT